MPHFNVSHEVEVSTSRVDSGKRKRRKNREKMKKKIKSLTDENKLQKKLGKYKQRLNRLKKAKVLDLTPRKKIEKLLNGKKCSNEVRKQLLFAEVLQM